MPPFSSLNKRLSAGVRCAATCATCCRAEFKTTVKFETVNQKIDFNGFCLLEKILIYNVCETVDIKHSIVFFLLIQSHCETRAASAALVQKNPDGLDLFVFKILSDHLCRRGGYLNHVVLL